MIIIGVDFHPEFQQIASVDTDSGEFQEKRCARNIRYADLGTSVPVAGQGHSANADKRVD